MARRIEIELTSDRGDGTWTWRAAGARQPKGTIDSGLLPPDSTVGSIHKVEVEGFLDGLAITAVIPPKATKAEPERIELLTRRSEGPLVTARVSRSPRGDGPGRGRRSDRGERGERSDGDRGERRDRSDRADRARGPRRTRPDDRARSSEDRRRERPSTPPPDAKPKPRRLRPGKTHRTALLESLPAEQRPIAEQLLQGGIPAVRLAIEKQNESLKAEGKQQVSPEPLLEVAEKLRNRAQTAVWRDRAEAALAHIEDLDLRDLRSVVNAAGDAGRDAEARELADRLRESLVGRVETEQAAWVAEVDENLREGRVVRALRLSSRPPKAGSPLPPNLSQQLVEATSAALTNETGPQRWSTVLDALAYSPIRRRVVPESLPTKLGPELRSLIERMADRLPEIAHIFDIKPGPPAPRERTRRGPKSGKPSDSKPRPPKPPKPDTAKAKAKPKAEAPKAAEAETKPEAEEPKVAATEETEATSAEDKVEAQAPVPEAEEPKVAEAAADPAPADAEAATEEAEVAEDNIEAEAKPDDAAAAESDDESDDATTETAAEGQPGPNGHSEPVTSSAASD
ncbi:MAG TPA: hypothetical protein VGJ86_06445 [Acidimicrobiales bacterium]|jgi:hypothetical protein